MRPLVTCLSLILLIATAVYGQSHETKAALMIPLTETALASLREAGCFLEVKSNVTTLSAPCVRAWLTPERFANLPIPGTGNLLLVSVGATEIGARGSVEQQIRSRCERDWPGDYRMQEHCIKTQTEAYQRLQRR